MQKRKIDKLNSIGFQARKKFQVSRSLFLKKKNIYLMGTDYSEKQAWIEGGLMLANKVLEDITQN